MQRLFLECSRHFDAAHCLRGYPGNCANLHGHRWKVDFCISGETLNEVGMLYDFKDLKRVLESQLPDHAFLNDCLPFKEENPTAENIALHLFAELSPLLLPHVRLEWVKVWETPDCCAWATRQKEANDA